jgi:hypothetical protein
MLYTSALTTAASGSINGLTASHNRGGRYFRSRTIPTDPATTYQLTMRQGLLALSTRWSGVLSNAQRAGWSDYATDTLVTNALGEMIALTGQQMYIRCNTPRYQAIMFGNPVGLTPLAPTISTVDDPPTIPGAAEVGFLSLDTAGSGTGARNDAGATATSEISWDDGTGPTWMANDDAVLLVYMSRPQIAAKNYFRGPYGFAQAIQGDSTTPPTSPNTDAVPPFGVEIGMKTFWRLQVSDGDGRLSNVFEGVTIGT